MGSDRIQVGVEQLACLPVRPEFHRRGLVDALAVAVSGELAAGSN